MVFMSGKLSQNLSVDGEIQNSVEDGNNSDPTKKARKAFHLAAIEENSRVIQIKMLLEQAPRAIASGLIAGALFVLGLWQVADHTDLLTWYFILLGLNLTRLFIANRARKGATRDYFQWENKFFVFLPAVGVVWGIGALYFLQDVPIEHQVFILLFCLGLVSGAVIFYAAESKVAMVSFLPIILPAMIFFAFQDTLFHKVLALALLLFLVAVYSAMMTLSRFLDNSFSLAAELKEEIAERILTEESLLNTKKSLEETNRLKDKFVSLVSHDLKAPLGNISMTLGVLQKSEAISIESSENAILDRAKDNCDGLLDMVDKLLDINLIKSGRIKPNKKFLKSRTFVERVTERLVTTADESGIALLIDIPDGHKIFVDSDLFSVVIQNLVHNAIKFSKKNDTVVVFVPESKPQSIGVKDSGVGVPKNFMKDLFSPETQTSSQGVRGEKGSGYGLPLCYDIMEAHSGALTFESNADEGSTFFCEFLKADAVILLVDDHDVVKREIRNYLNGLDVEFIEAKNGYEAMERIIDVKPHIIITDILMPKMNGFELLDKLQKTSLTKSIPVIVMTSDQETETREKAFSLGAKDFVTKPIIPNDFLPRVKRFISD